MRPEGLGKLRTFTHLIGCRTRDLPACSIVPQSLLYRFTHIYIYIYISHIPIQLKGLFAALIQWDVNMSSGKL
jgi:hypothetical protein